MDVLRNITEDKIFSLSKSIDDIYIEGLKRKGFVFKHKLDLVNFIKARCYCVHQIHLKQKTYLVDGTPFLVHYYESSIDIKKSENSFGITMTVEAGSFEYL